MAERKVMQGYNQREQRNPEMGRQRRRQSHHSFSKPATATTRVSPPSSSSSSCSVSPVQRKMNQNESSDGRSNEAVVRVAGTIREFVNGCGRIEMWKNKQFNDLHENNTGLLYIPKGDDELDRGDFDILIVSQMFGYLYIEVKAFGDIQTQLDETKVIMMLTEVLEKKGVSRLQKGRRALQLLQPTGERVNIVTTLALPNVSRQLLRKALRQNPELRSKLAECMTGAIGAEVSVEDLVLCADDLPPKDGVVDVSDVRVSAAITTWWSTITRIGASTQPISDASFRLILASLRNNDEVLAGAQSVNFHGTRDTQQDRPSIPTTNTSQVAGMEKEAQQPSMKTYAEAMKHGGGSRTASDPTLTRGGQGH